MTEVILAIDAGTTGVTALLIDRAGRVLARGYQELTQYYPQPGWVEHDPEEIWQATIASTRTALAQVQECEPVAIGCANQRETLLVWDRQTGRPLHRAIVWQCRRSEPICHELRSQGWEAEIRRKTGLRLDPYFSGTKALWLIRNDPELAPRIAREDVCFGTVDTWLAWKMSGGEVYSTDQTNASRTLCYDIDRLDWDDGLLALFGLNRGVVPTVSSSGAVRGHSSSAGLPAGVPIASLVGDQQAALFGQTCFESGLIKATYGTGCFILSTTGGRRVDSTRGLITTLAAARSLSEPSYAIEGSVFIAGAALQWCRDQLRLFETSEDGVKLADSVDSSGGVIFVPAFSGLGSPHWDADVRGSILGLTAASESAHILRAALDAMVYQAQDVLEAMAESGVQIRELRVDGGAAANDRLMQLQSDVSGVQLSRPVSVETTALGAAFLAGLAVGFWKDESEIASLHQEDRRFKPSSQTHLAKGGYREWCKAIDMLLRGGEREAAPAGN